MTLFATPFDPSRADPLRWNPFFQFVAEHPGWFSTPAGADASVLMAASLVADTARNITYEVWRDQDLVGVLLLSKVVPGVDALFHFVFMDQLNLKGKRRLLLNFLDLAYTDLGFSRLTMEIPEPYGTLQRFARKHLGFTHEGERAILNDPAVPPALKAVPGWQTWVSRVGSRREGAHWHHDRWADVMILRQTADEFAAFRKDLPQEG